MEKKAAAPKAKGKAKAKAKSKKGKGKGKKACADEAAVPDSSTNDGAKGKRPAYWGSPEAKKKKKRNVAAEAAPEEDNEIDDNATALYDDGDLQHGFIPEAMEAPENAKKKIGAKKQAKATKQKTDSILEDAMPKLCTDGKKTFARRFCPSTKKGQMRWTAVKDAFEEHIFDHLKTPSRHEDLNMLFYFYGFIWFWSPEI